MRVLISAHTGLGNFILKTPFFHAILKQFKNCRIDLLFDKKNGLEDVINDSKIINNFYYLMQDASFLEKHSLFLELRKNKYDIVFLPFDSTSKSILFKSQFYLSKSKIISHINIYDKSFKQKISMLLYLFYSEVEWVPILKGYHEIDLNFDLLQAALPKKLKRDRRTIVNYTYEDISFFNLSKSYIVIQPSAANGALTPKIWDPENFKELIKRFLKYYPNSKVVFVGDSGDASSLHDSNILSENGCVNLLGKTTFNQLCNVLKGALVTISHDSGVMHIANAMQIPMIALYGPTDFIRTAPLSPTVKVLHSRNDCWGIMRDMQPGIELNLAKKYINYYCMSGISVDQVMSNLNVIIDTNNE